MTSREYPEERELQVEKELVRATEELTDLWKAEEATRKQLLTDLESLWNLLRTSESTFREALLKEIAGDYKAVYESLMQMTSPKSSGDAERWFANALVLWDSFISPSGKHFQAFEQLAGVQFPASASRIRELVIAISDAFKTLEVETLHQRAIQTRRVSLGRALDVAR